MTDLLPCPSCDTPMSGESGPETIYGPSKPPRPGDLGFCIVCMARLVYYEKEAELKVRVMTDEEFEAANELTQASILQAEGMARQIRGAPPRVSSMVDKVNQLGHAVGEVDRAISEALFRLSQAQGHLIQKHGEDEITKELGRVLEILERTVK